MTIILSGTQGTTTPGLYSNTTFTGTYADGIVLDYTTGLGRISVGTADGLAFYNAGVATTELMRLDSSGNLGIGTSSTTFKLNVNQTSSGGVTPNLNSTVQVYAKGYQGSNTTYAGIGFAMYEHTNGYWGSGILARDDTNNYGAALTFYTSTGSATPTPTEAMRITSSGNVGIGTSSPSYKLDVAGQIRSSSSGYVFPDGTTKVTNSGPQVTVYASGSGTYTVPANAKWVTVRMVGGGAGGGSSVGATAGGGGGAGGYLEGLVTSLSATYSYAVGSGGGASANGGATTFGSALFTANGGSTGTSNATAAPGGAGGSASGGYLNQTGSSGGYGWASNPYYNGGFGAGTAFGSGGSGGGTGNGGGSASVVYGSGGGGGVGGGTGGTGAPGVIIVTAYF